MKYKDFQKLMEDSTVEGKVDLETVHKKMNEFYDGVWEAKEKKITENLTESLRPSVKDEFIKSLGIENVENEDQYKAYVKRMSSDSTELTEANGRLSKELDDTKTLLNEATENNKGLISKLTGFERTSQASKKGFAPKYLSAAKREAEDLISDDVTFEDALELVAKDYPEWTNAKKSLGGKTPAGGKVTEEEETARMRELGGL